MTWLKFSTFTTVLSHVLIKIRHCKSTQYLLFKIKSTQGILHWSLYDYNRLINSYGTSCDGTAVLTCNNTIRLPYLDFVRNYKLHRIGKKHVTKSRGNLLVILINVWYRLRCVGISIKSVTLNVMGTLSVDPVITQVVTIDKSYPQNTGTIAGDYTT